MRTLPLSEVAGRFAEIADEVATTREPVQVTRNGREHVVLLAADDLASLETTLDLMSDPASQARAADSERDITHGDVLDDATVRALLPRESAG